MGRYVAEQDILTDNQRVVAIEVDIYDINPEGDRTLIARAVGTSTCHPNDEFDYMVGCQMALARGEKAAALELAEKAVELWERGQLHQKLAYKNVQAKEVT